MSLARAKDSMCRLDLLAHRHEQASEEDNSMMDRLSEQFDRFANDSDEDAIGFAFDEGDDGDAVEGNKKQSQLLVEDQMVEIGIPSSSKEDDNALKNSTAMKASSSSSDASKSTYGSDGLPRAKLNMPSYGMYNPSSYGVADYYAGDGGYDDFYGDYDEDYSDVFCCLNPWANNNNGQKDRNNNDDQIFGGVTSSNTSGVVFNYEPQMAVSLRENIKHEGPSDHQQKTTPTPSTTPSDGSIDESESLDPEKDGLSKRRGILKYGGTMGSIVLATSKLPDLPGKNTGTNSTRRRSLFPSAPSIERRYSIRNNEKHEKELRWASMARVMNVPALNEVSLIERTSVWWQRSDYEDFKKAGRIISKSMLQGGSQVWLKTSASVKNANSKHFEEDHGESWWCKFGHSRRGLEHVTDVEQGKSRQRNVIQSIQAVIGEQRKQRIMQTYDRVKLASVASRYTR